MVSHIYTIYIYIHIYYYYIHNTFFSLYFFFFNSQTVFFFYVLNLQSPKVKVGHQWPLHKTRQTCNFTGGEILDRCGNDPSAGSPTETLLRLHLPLSDKVWTSSRGRVQ